LLAVAGRQIARWSQQYLDGVDAGRDPNMDRLIEWLPANIPAGDETAIVHGDCRIDDMIFHPIEPRVMAVLDWELSTLDHPLADFAYNAMMYHIPPHIVAGLAGADLAALNLPSESAYCARTGRTEIPNYAFYIAFNFFRMAAIFHGIKGRSSAARRLRRRRRNEPTPFPNSPGSPGDLPPEDPVERLGFDRFVITAFGRSREHRRNRCKGFARLPMLDQDAIVSHGVV
jgi:aminoglycoside phosphotransferase (APT) family kinase protein